MSRIALRPLMLLAGGYHLAVGFFIAVAPHGFYDAVATYPPYNEHFLRDIATFYLALGAVMVVAAARRSWQVPILVLALVQYALHVVNHLIDVGDTDPGWQGPLNLVSIAVVGVALLWLLQTAATSEDQSR